MIVDVACWARYQALGSLTVDASNKAVASHWGRGWGLKKLWEIALLLATQNRICYSMYTALGPIFGSYHGPWRALFRCATHSKVHHHHHRSDGGSMFSKRSANLG